tara:strand:+ start:394 stop:639 length:246 start_codon:yes stop_codon:yes gene_type:complete
MAVTRETRQTFTLTRLGEETAAAPVGALRSLPLLCESISTETLPLRPLLPLRLLAGAPPRGGSLLVRISRVHILAATASMS